MHYIYKLEPITYALITICLRYSKEYFQIDKLWQIWKILNNFWVLRNAEI